MVYNKDEVISLNRGKKIVLLSHCILNANSKVEGLSKYPSAVLDLISFLSENGIGMIQLPCPEMSMYGMKRWGHVKEQFDTPIFREHSRVILNDIAMQVRDYVSNGYTLVGVIGIDGSPSCGINKTCSSKSWGGESKSFDEAKFKDVSTINEKGVFIEELLLSLLPEVQLPLFSVDESLMDSSLANLKSEILKALNVVQTP